MNPIDFVQYLCIVFEPLTNFLKAKDSKSLSNCWSLFFSRGRIQAYNLWDSPIKLSIFFWRLKRPFITQTQSTHRFTYCKWKLFCSTSNGLCQICRIRGDTYWVLLDQHWKLHIFQNFLYVWHVSVVNAKEVQGWDNGITFSLLY